MRNATPGERRRLLFEIYRTLEESKTALSYSGLHEAVRSVQADLERDTGVRLGYDFEESNYITRIDPKLQDDIETLDFWERGHNADAYFGPKAGMKTHRLGTTEYGRAYARFSASVRGKTYAMGRSRADLRTALDKLPASRTASAEKA